MERYGRIVKVKPEKYEYYKKLHANPWTEVSDAIEKCNIRNFSIYYKDGYLFSYYEYIGKDYKNDMDRLSDLTRHWLKETDQCQLPIETAEDGELWVDMLEIFHQD